MRHMMKPNTSNWASPSTDITCPTTTSVTTPPKNHVGLSNLNKNANPSVNTIVLVFATVYTDTVMNANDKLLSAMSNAIAAPTGAKFRQYTSDGTSSRFPRAFSASSSTPAPRHALAIAYCIANCIEVRNIGHGNPPRSTPRICLLNSANPVPVLNHTSTNSEHFSPRARTSRIARVAASSPSRPSRPRPRFARMYRRTAF